LPITVVVFFQQSDGRAPVREWLAELRHRDSLAYERCLARISRLAQLGYELRRPEADFLRDGIYELRVRRGHMNYRILYCFQGRAVAVLAHALVKEDTVPETDIRRALERKALLEANPHRHMQED
jgi:putative component of toxin-antitoxin plasmid stabilization module